MLKSNGNILIKIAIITAIAIIAGEIVYLYFNDGSDILSESEKEKVIKAKELHWYNVAKEYKDSLQSKDKEISRINVKIGKLQFQLESLMKSKNSQDEIIANWDTTDHLIQLQRISTIHNIPTTGKALLH